MTMGVGMACSRLVYDKLLRVLLQASLRDCCNTQHEQRKAEQSIPVAQRASTAGVAKGPEHQLPEMIGGKQYSDGLQEVRQKHQRHPKAAAETHRQVNHVRYARRRTER